MNVCPHPVDQLSRHFRINQPIGKSQRHTQNEQNAAHDGGALNEHFAVIPRDLDVAIDEHFHDERAECRQRRGFRQRAKAAEQANHHDHGKQQFPFRLPDSPAGFLEMERLADGIALQSFVNPDGGHAAHHQKFWQQCSDEQFVDGSLRVHAIQNGGHAGGEQQAKRAGRSEQADGEVFRIAGAHQQRHQQAPQRQNGQA